MHMADHATTGAGGASSSRGSCVAAMSLVAGLAPAPPVLIAARGLQGVGAALTVPAAVAIIASTFAEGAERNRALGVFGASASAGFSVGLVLGGVLTDALGWRLIFLVKVPFAVAAAGVALRVVAEGRTVARRAGYDVAGALTSALGLVLVVLTITQLASRTLPAVLLVAAAVAGAVLLALFAVIERRTRDALLPLDLLALRTPRVSDLASLTVLAAPFGFSFVTTLWMQDVLDRSALETGLALLPGAALSMVVSRYVAPRLVDRFGLRASATGAMVVVSIGFLTMLRVGTTMPYAPVLLPASLLCLGLGMGVAYPAYTIGAVTAVDEARQGVAAGLQNTALQVGGGLGLAVVSAAVSGSLGAAGSPGDYVHALRIGTIVGATLPLIGAAVTFLGLRPGRRADRSAEGRDAGEGGAAARALR